MKSNLPSNLKKFYLFGRRDSQVKFVLPPPLKNSSRSLSGFYFLMVEMKPVKAFASCTARCASYGAAVLHILRHCRKMLHKSTSSQAMPQSLRTFTDDYRQGDEKICPFLSVSGCICQSQNTMVIFLLILWTRWTSWTKWTQKSKVVHIVHLVHQVHWEFLLI